MVEHARISQQDLAFYDPFTVYVNPYYVITSFTNGDKVSKHYYMGTQRVATDLGVSYTTQSSSSESIATNSSENTMTSLRTSEGSGSVENTLAINIMNIIGQTSSDTLKKQKFSNLSLEQAYPETSPFASQEIPQYGGEDPGGYTPQGRILYWYHPDYIQNVDLITDIDGAAYELFLYNPWGEQLHHWTSSSSSWTSPYRFNAKELDPETGLSYYGARYYQSKLGVWLSVDSKAALIPGWTPYSYSFNNSIVFIDPDGQLPIPLITGLIGAAGGGIYGLVTGKSWKEAAALVAGGFVAGATLGFGTSIIATAGGVATLGGAGTAYSYGATGLIGAALSNITEQGTKNLLGEQDGFNENEFVMSLAFSIPETLLSEGVTGPISNSIKGSIAKELTKEATFKQEKQFLKQATKSLKEMSGGQITNKQARTAAQKMYNMARETEQGVINATIYVADKVVDVSTVTVEKIIIEPIKEQTGN